MKILVGAQIKDSTGKIVKTLRFRRAHSFTLNFVKCLFIHLANATATAVSPSVIDQTNTARAALVANTPFNATCPAGTTTSGILIGSGTNATAITDVALQTQITTNVAHGIQTFLLNTPTGNTMELIMSRTFTNNTGSPLTINEIGIFSNVNTFAVNILLDRTRFTTVVETGMSITFVYKFNFFA